MAPSVLEGTQAPHFTRLFEYYLSNRGSAAGRPPSQDATSASAVTVWFKGVGSRSFFCRIVRSVVSSNSKGAGSFNSRTDVADVDGVNCWGPVEMRETLICTGDCFEGARHIRTRFLFCGEVVIVVQQSLYLERAALDLSLHPHRSFWLTRRNYLQDIPNRGFTLRLFVENHRTKTIAKIRGHSVILVLFLQQLTLQALLPSPISE